jgi:Flp pilus assembly protein TadG
MKLKMKLFKRKNSVAPFMQDQSGLAAVEFAMIFPMMIMLLLGTVELGNGILANQKVIASSQIVADLLARTEEVTDDQLSEAKRAGRMALAPFSTGDIGFDIVSFRFDPDNADAGTEPQPVIVWRDTDNMEAIADLEERVMPLALADEGAIVVFVEFPYEPPFGTSIVGHIDMLESTFTRGRKSAVVERN